MSRIRMIGLALLGIIVPVALGFTAYFVSRSTIGSAGTVPGMNLQRTEPPTSPPNSRSPKSGQSPSDETASPTPVATPTDDHGGGCSEPEHSSDPSCTDGSGGGSGSGSGSGDDSGSNSGSSGSSSAGSSGPGGGDD